jgi:nuclear pore complex protein Nup93
LELKNNSRKWLEQSYLEWLKNHVRGRRMQIGGIPTVHMEVDAMIRLRFKRNDIWSVQWLDTSTVPDQAFWAHVFLLIRCGLNHEALEYVKMNQKYLENTTDRYFATYLSAWISSPDGILPKNLSDRLLTEWNGHIRDILADSRLPPRGDVFRFTLYKIIGQCEMNSKNVKCDAVISSTDDYLWLQLMLVRPTRRSDPPYQRYTMKDFATKMVSYGPSYFKSTSIYYMVLLLCGEFERAVEILSKDPAFAIDALHVAIALVYLGTLRVPVDPTVFNLTGSLLSITSTPPNADGSTSEVVTFDFARFLLSYVKRWSYSNSLESLQYIYTLGLLGGSSSGLKSVTSQKAYTEMVYAGIRDVILCTDSFLSILGEIRPDGTRSPGELDKFKSLIHLNTSEELADRIILPAAQAAETTGIAGDGETMFSKTVQLYHLAGRYEYVITLLNRKLSELLCGHQYFISSAADMNSTGAAFPSNSKNIVELSQQLVSFYRSRPHLLSVISSKALDCCALLISLHKFMFEVQNKLDVQALISLERLDILPLNPELLTVQRKVDLFRNIDDTVARVIPDVLVAAMTCLERLYNPPKGAAKDSSTRDSLKMQAKAILMFAGCVQYRISGDVFATLNRLDVLMI